MRKIISLLLVLILSTGFAFGGTSEDVPPEAGAEISAPRAVINGEIERGWFEISENREVLTVRLHTGPDSGKQWSFEMPDNTVELLTMETLPDENLFIASFFAPNKLPARTYIQFRYAEDAQTEPETYAEVDLEVSEGGKLRVIAAAEKDYVPDWLTLDAETNTLTFLLDSFDPAVDVASIDIFPQNLLVSAEETNAAGYALKLTPVPGASGSAEVSIISLDASSGLVTFLNAQTFVDTDGHISVGTMLRMDTFE